MFLLVSLFVRVFQWQMVLRADYKVCRPAAQLIPNLKGLSHEKPGWLIQHFHLSKAGHWTLCKSSRDLTFIPFSRTPECYSECYPVLLYEKTFCRNISSHWIYQNKIKTWLNKNFDLRFQKFLFLKGGGRGAVTSVHTSMFIESLSLTQMETLDCHPIMCIII